MATLTVSLPDPIEAWIEGEVVGRGGYASASDYIRDLVRRDRARRGEAMTEEELRVHLHRARLGGRSSRSLDDIFENARGLAHAAGSDEPL